MPTFETLTIIAHVGLGTLAVGAGALALAARKGRKIHIRAGQLFVATMGLASLLGAILGVLRFETLWITAHAGILGATLVASGVMAVRIHARTPRRLFAALAAVNALNAAGLGYAGWLASTLPGARLFGFAAADYVFLCAMAAIASAADARLLLGTQISHSHRIAQHLSRMCIGFFIAAGSAFTGPGAAAFPEAIRASGLLSLPELTIILLMLFWLWKTLRRPRRAPATP